MFPSIGLSVISSMIEVKFGIGFGHEFVFESWELVCTTGFLIKFEVEMCRVGFDGCFHFEVGIDSAMTEVMAYPGCRRELL